MSTNASISIQLGKKGGKTIYQHWDGTPKYSGKTLLKFYNTEEKVKELISLGNISILGECVGSKVDFDLFDSRTEIQCLAYGRDRGDEEQEATCFDESPEDIREFNYLFKNGKWYFSEYEGKYSLLTLKKCK